MHDFLMWYRVLWQSASFKRAQLLIVLLGLFLLGLGYAWVNGQGVGWLLILAVPIWVVGSMALEQFSWAYKLSRLRYAALESYATDSVTTQQDSVAAQPNRVTTQEEESWSGISDEGLLILCQFYVFLYLLFELRLSGEKTHYQLVGIPARKYRELADAIAQPDIALLIAQPGKSVTAQLSFDAALQKIAQHDNNLTLWDFPYAVYDNERNWREYKPNEIELAPGRIAILNRMKKGDSTPTLLPIYPTSLNDLNISLKS